MHALTLEDAAITYADVAPGGTYALAGRPISEPEMTEIALLIAPEWDITCREVEDRIALLARVAGKPFQAGSQGHFKPPPLDQLARHIAWQHRCVDRKSLL